MTLNQFDELLTKYDNDFKARKIPVLKRDTASLVNSSEAPLVQPAHLRWMISKLREDIARHKRILDVKDGDDTAIWKLPWYAVAKLHRWLGFIQATLHTMGLYTVDELVGHVEEAKN